ncbi:hypothetical protein [Streptomyces aureoversilis]|uniref:Uncharacterized protein n=1 Tax=Streptomyces aureoversilis TaxID=67277 RepID=A0ABW0AAH7_9ACTN
MDLQTGMRVYQFVRDRQDEQRDRQYPEGHDTYVQERHKAHQLSQNYADAVQADDTGEADRPLGELTSMASQWNTHPHYPHPHLQTHQAL